MHVGNNATLRRTDYDLDSLLSLCGGIVKAEFCCHQTQVMLFRFKPDCPRRIDGKEVEYRLKKHDIDEPINFQRLLTPTTAPAYRAEVIRYLRYLTATLMAVFQRWKKKLTQQSQVDPNILAIRPP